MERKDFFLVSENSKHSLYQACSQGLSVAKRPPLQLIVHFENNTVVKTRLSIAPVFSCLFLGPGSHKAMEDIVVWCAKYTEKMSPSPTSYIKKSQLSHTQQEILDCIANIPFGHTMTSYEVARIINTDFQTVEKFCSYNPFVLLYPCHRVIRENYNDSSLGEQTRNILLQFEGIHLK
ncbi:6-O-methylguanine DNA methyltransferase, DNA binding domain protein [Chlamydia ibidis]|uniref:6-O-methylguanine DNA methyltransferase, DNA binding domain protein n=1 Tax=Chlamydia ibidis TaxID=1405396 RepID=S7J5R6_9CHLA|nr:MGMT family protein [Chlamydia ibidis]EPP35432.1 6-O-methylguanine DNA methyltransferase, DNA binding domain protein [Chlamydia ibidis]